MNLCPFSKFKYLLGIPKKGVHKYRFLDTAIIDYVLTLFLSIIITLVTKVPLVLSTIFSFILGIVLHIIFGLETNTVKYLGIKCKS